MLKSQLFKMHSTSYNYSNLSITRKGEMHPGPQLRRSRNKIKMEAHYLRMLEGDATP